MVVIEKDCDGDVFMFFCVDIFEGIDIDVVIVDICGIIDVRDKVIDVDDVVGLIKSDNFVDIDDRGGIFEKDDKYVCDWDVDFLIREVDKMDVFVNVVILILFLWFKEFDCENDGEEWKVVVDDFVECWWDIVKNDVVVFEFNDLIEKVFECGIIVVVDGVSVDFLDIDGIVVVDINVVLDIFDFVDVVECDKFFVVVEI